MSILGQLGMRAFIIAFGVLLFVETCAGLVLNKIIKNDNKSDFIQALPDIRVPNLKAVLKKTYYRLYWFLKEAFPVFIYSAVLLFCIDRIGFLDLVKDSLKPIIINFLGFPLEMVDVLLLCMIRHEAASAMLIKLVEAGKINYVQSIVAVVLTTMFVPCLANIIAIFKECKLKVALIMVLTINSTSFIIAGFLNWILIWLFL